jgi:hypothetical protein
MPVYSRGTAFHPRNEIAMANYLLGINQTATIKGGAQSGDTLTFAGQGVLGAPIVTLTGSETFSALTDAGTADQAGYGNVNLSYGSAMTTNDLTVDHATLTINEMWNTAVVLNGASKVSHGGILIADGYRGYSNYVLNGTMSIEDGCTVNFSSVAMTGTGQFALNGAAASLWLGSTAASATVKLDSGHLNLTNGMAFLGTITDAAPNESRIGSTAEVDIYNAATAASEMFDRTTGQLSLFDAQGGQLAALHFAGQGDLYAAPVSGVGGAEAIAITSHPLQGALPVTFMH